MMTVKIDYLGCNLKANEHSVWHFGIAIMYVHLECMLYLIVLLSNEKRRDKHPL